MSSTEPLKTYKHAAINDAILSIARQIAAQHAQDEKIIVVGIANGGVPFAQKLCKALKEIETPEIVEGYINITFHRDDIGQNPIPEEKLGTTIPCNIENQLVILADDVLFSGRTVRAAMNEIFDQGRPSNVELAVLFDRGNRRLPIQPNYTGFLEGTTLAQRVHVSLNMKQPALDAITVTH